MNRSTIKYLLALLLFGSNGIVASRISMNSYEIVMFRTLIGSLLLIVLYLATNHRFTFYKHKKSFAFLALSGIAMGVSWLFLFEAYQRIGVSIASLGYYCGPVRIRLCADPAGMDIFRADSRPRAVTHSWACQYRNRLFPLLFLYWRYSRAVSRDPRLSRTTVRDSFFLFISGRTPLPDPDRGGVMYHRRRSRSGTKTNLKPGALL